MIEKKSRKHAKLLSKKVEKVLKPILVPLIAQLTLGINKKIDFEKYDFEHIFDNPSFFLTHNVQRKKRSRNNGENTLNYGAKRQRRS